MLTPSRWTGPNEQGPLHASPRGQSKIEIHVMKRSLDKVVLCIFVAALLVISTTACKHTAHGAGQDIEKVGEKIQDKTR
jgi:predicted small secreted protein